MLRRIKCSLVQCSIVTFMATVALAGGPPMIAVEMPAAAFDKGSKDAVMIVRTSQCGTPIEAAVSARADGIVDGVRKTIPIKLRSTSKTGTYAVQQQWPTDGRWVLTFSYESHGRVTAYVELPAPGATGTAAAPAVRTVHERVSAKEIDALLANVS